MKEKNKIGIIGNASTGKSLAYELAKNKCGLPIVVVPKGTLCCCECEMPDINGRQGLCGRCERPIIV